MRIGYGRLTIVTATVLILGAVAFAAPPAGGRGPSRRGLHWEGGGTRRGEPGVRVFVTRRLDLTDEQTEKIRDIVRRSRADAREVGEAIIEARKALHDSVTAGSEENQVRAAVQALAKATGDQAIARSQTLALVREILTDEQRQKLEEMKERGGRSRERVRGRRGLGRPGPRQTGHWARAKWLRGRPRRGYRAGQGGLGWQDRASRGAPRSGSRWASAVDGFARRPGRSGAPWATSRPPVNRRAPAGVRGRQGRGPLPVGRIFERADTNDDEVLSKEELDSFRDRLRARREPRPW